MHTGADFTTQNSKRAGKKPSQPAAVRGADSVVNPEFVQRIDWLPTLVAGQTRSPEGERLVWLSARVVSERQKRWKGRTRTRTRKPGARARRWRQLLEDGVYPSRAALARAEGVSRAAVTQGLGRVGV